VFQQPLVPMVYRLTVCLRVDCLRVDCCCFDFAGLMPALVNCKGLAVIRLSDGITEMNTVNL